MDTVSLRQAPIPAGQEGVCISNVPPERRSVTGLSTEEFF
jgi:hypothetical protein